MGRIDCGEVREGDSLADGRAVARKSWSILRRDEKRMSGNIFDQMREAALRKAQELDEKYELRAKIEEGVNAASEVAREQFEKIDEQYRVTESVKERVAQAGIDETARAAEERAREIFGAARGYYEQAGRAWDFTARTAGAAGAVTALTDVYARAREWVRDNPGKATVVTLSLIAGIRAGSSIPSLGVTLVGSGFGDHWLFHSALPVVGLRKLSSRYQDYLRTQEALLAGGQLDEAERQRLEFQQRMARYVGAPLLGAFSVAAGATMIGAAFSGATATGLPISLLLGGNPLLNGIWFFANGVICISEGYNFFMIALADQAEVERVVRQVQGLLTA